MLQVKMGTLLDRVEEVVTEQYRKGRRVEEARVAISAAIDPENATSPAGPGGESEPSV